MLPLEPVCRGRIVDRGCGVDEGLISSPLQLLLLPNSSAVSSAVDRVSWAASILAVSAIRRSDMALSFTDETPALRL
jgi:hypothetical protein